MKSLMKGFLGLSNSKLGLSFSLFSIPVKSHVGKWLHGLHSSPPELIFKGRVAYVTHAYVPLSKPDSHSLSLFVYLSVCLYYMHNHTHPHKLWVVYVVARDFLKPLMVERENLWFSDLGIALAFFATTTVVLKLCSFFSEKNIQYYMENGYSMCNMCNI